MKKDKFLTVFAVFDEKTQKKLQNLQNKVLKLGYLGTQTMGIPFHISLGSFPVADEKILQSKIKEVCASNFEFEIDLDEVNHFNNKVLFIQPKENETLIKLHNFFDNNYADGFSWHAHATIFCGDEKEVIKAKDVLNKNFKPIKAKIVGIQMGEFFPADIKVREQLCAFTTKNR